jgi:hypothetical protein
MYFTREALEQASGEAVSRYRAERFRPFMMVADIGCGIGGDTLALAQHTNVLAVDVDPLRLAMAEQNAIAYGVRERVRFLCADIRTSPLPGVDAIFVDPDRRPKGKRRLGVEDWQPPLGVIREWTRKVPAVGVKMAPGVDLAELADFDAEVEFISVGGELKECVLWFGPLRTARRRATLLGQRCNSITGLEVPAIPLSEPRAYLYDPDPAVIRAGLVNVVAAQIGASQLDQDIAYLTSDKLCETPYARPYRIEEAMPFELKRLRAALQARDVGRLTVKRRGSPVDPDDLIRRLRLRGTEHRMLFLTHVAGKPVALIAERS